MNKVEIMLNEVSKIKRFVNVVEKFDADIDIIKYRYVIDAKSIMGILSLDLSKPLDVVIHTEDTDVLNKFIEAMEEFK